MNDPFLPSSLSCVLSLSWSAFCCDGEVTERLLPRPVSIALVLVLGILLRWLDDDGEVDSSGTESFSLAAAVSSTSQ
jgi:hypothetical protein